MTATQCYGSSAVQNETEAPYRRQCGPQHALWFLQNLKMRMKKAHRDRRRGIGGGSAAGEIRLQR